ncbi:MAG: methionine--tRNA ligase [bacterium]
MKNNKDDKDYKDYFYVTTPIYYVNDKPHIGHAYSTVIADSIARFKKLSGYKVFFLTGTDEHGLKIEKEADSRGISPKELADSVHIKFKELFSALGISCDRFIRTTDADHVKTVGIIFEKLLKNGDIYLSEYEGWYCTPCETFLTEKALADGNCPQCGRPASKVKEESYFLKLEKYEKRLLDYIESNPGFIKPDFRKNEVLSFIKEGLKDLSISRTSFKWGIPVPDNDKHVVYVWFDALLNYLTGLGYENFLEGKKSDFEPFFKTSNHIVGKDILKFHAVYWPIMLFALGLEPPKTILAHGWWLMDGRKMSKSTGNVIDPVDLIGKFGGPDPLRFYLLSEITLGLDGDFNMNNFVTRYNSGLANDLGNLVSRTAAMLKKYTGGRVPDIGETFDRDSGIAGSGAIGTDERLNRTIYEIAVSLNDRYDNYDFARILEETFRLINMVNKYINDEAPWKLSISEPYGLAKLNKILRTAVISIYCISYLIYPFMPDTSKRINEILKVDDFESFKYPLTPEDIAGTQTTIFKKGPEMGQDITTQDYSIPESDWIFKAGHKISENVPILFPKII